MKESNIADNLIVLFLTNNNNTMGLFNWLKERENVVLVEKPIDIEEIVKRNPVFVISYNSSHIIPKDVIEYMNGRIINLHISFLPWNKGSNPNFWSFIDNTPKGVTIHEVNQGLDTGDILLQEAVEFDENKETFKSSYDKLHMTIQNLFKNNWDDIRENKINKVKQVGEGSYHTMKQFEKLAKANPVNWNEVISNYKQQKVDEGRNYNDTLWKTKH